MKKNGVRIVALIIVFLLVAGLFSSVIAIFAYAAEPIQPDLVSGSVEVTQTNPPTNPCKLVARTEFNLKFEFKFIGQDFDLNNKPKKFKVTGGSFDWNTNTVISMDRPVDNIYTVNINGLTYNGGSNRTLSIMFEVPKGDTTEPYPITLDIPIPEEYFLYPPSSSGSSSESSSDSSYEDNSEVRIYTADTTVSKQLTVGESENDITVTFYFAEIDGELDVSGERYVYQSNEFSMPANSSFTWGRSSTVTVTGESRTNGRYRAVVRNISYNGGSEKMLRIKLDSYGETFEIPISSKYFDDKEDEKDTAADIIVESVIAVNAQGQRLLDIDKDTKPFSVEILYYDVGLMNVDKKDLENAKLSAFVTNATGFKTLGGTTGKLELVSAKTQYPRFKVTFNNIQCDGTANSLGFRVQYDIPDIENSIKGEGTAIMYQITKDSEESEDEVAPLKPNVIVSAYSFGEEAIVAGDQFDLNITFKNTSKSVGVENVVMTIEPDNGFAIAAASNTDYFATMAPGESIPYAVALKANPKGDSTQTNATEYSVMVKFSYQYLSKKEYATGETSVKIAIPVVQLDRFAIDEITDYTVQLQVSEEGYVTVPITNKGKSLTYNISGSIKGPDGLDFVAPPVHFGNLEAGKTGSIDINITINTPGQFDGQAVIVYEDENMEPKELTAPFSIMVVAMEVAPPQIDQGFDPNAQQPKGPGILPIAFCGAGGLMIASPIALYLIKRAKARGLEDIDEDF